MERDEKKKVVEMLDSKIVKVISGVRRSGKSVFSLQLLEGKKYGYINFDDEMLAGIKTQDLNSILEVFTNYTAIFDTCYWTRYKMCRIGSFLLTA